jgi:hypothetical protein
MAALRRLRSSDLSPGTPLHVAGQSSSCHNPLAGALAAVTECDTLHRMTDEQSALIKVERSRLSAMLILFAASRDLEATASGDQRFIAAADAIKQIEATLPMIDDAVLLKLVSVNETSEGALSQLIAARLSEVGFALPLYEDAPSFFAPISDKVDTILRNARPHMH